MLTRFLPSRSEHTPQGGGNVVACETSGHHHSHTLSQRIAWRGGKDIGVNLSLSHEIPPSLSLLFLYSAFPPSPSHGLGTRLVHSLHIALCIHIIMM